MAVTTDRGHRRALHPLHAILLASAIPLFLGALLSDWAYASSYEVQWTNFASWLILGGLVFGGFALVWAFIEWLRDSARRAKSLDDLLSRIAGDVGGRVH